MFGNIRYLKWFLIKTCVVDNIWGMSSNSRGYSSNLVVSLTLASTSKHDLDNLPVIDF